MIYLITGLMASGKSTVAELLAGRFDRSVHLRGDVFRRMIARGREDMSEEPSNEALRQLELRYRLSAHTAKEYSRAGFTVVLQDNYYGEQLPRMMERLMPESAFAVILCPDVETIKRREAGRSKNGYTDFDIDTLYREFMASTPRIGLWLDNSSDTPEDTVIKILSEGNDDI